MVAILRGQPNKARAIQSNTKQVVIQWIAALRQIVGHKIQLPGFFIHPHDFLHNHFPVLFAEQIPHTLSGFIIPIEVCISAALALPNGQLSICRYKV